MKIKKVVIVGGGSSGWMTAAALCKRFPEMEITLVESDNIKTIGVGESTLFGINQYLSLLGIEDSEWMAECDATYKVSIKFTDFKEKGDSFQYPFGGGSHVAGTNVPMGLDCFGVLKQLNPELSGNKFAEFYNPITYLANKNKLTLNEDESLPVFDFNNDTAYHLDSTKFGIYLRDKICKDNGVTHIVDEVKTVNKKDDQNIDNIVLESGKVLHADLFVDCTGFKSLLLEKTLGTEFISFKDGLINDRAIATKLNYDNKEQELENVTNCTAIENGWVWNIPLWDKIGSGYVYSSDFVSRDQAEIEFRNHLKSKGKTIPEDSEILDIEIKHGRHSEAWVGNVLSVGLSYGFIEPLESTGLFTTHEIIYKFVRILERRDGFISQLDKSLLNHHMTEMMDRFKSFIEMHYALSMRDDTEYWRHVTSKKYNGYDIEELSRSIISSSNLNSILGGLAYITAGMGYFPSYRIGYGPGCVLPEDVDAFTNMEREYQMFSESLYSYVESLPSSYEFLKNTIYN